ncbi:MAG: cytochrome c biogenesis protein ResB [Cyanobacteria bacterium SBLK]|nr:cytochrome c biogenesis protein ResB [Cyanobacteria bacterium SBLK]
MQNRIFRFLGSIQFAVPLLGAIAIILIGATFYESQVGSATVQQEIYKSPWFGALMFLLALNLGVSALSRHPWRGARKIGFALTHLGLIVIIAGSAAVIHLGVEGMLPLRTDLGANNQIRVQGDLLEVADASGDIQQAGIFVKPDGSISPRTFAGLSLLGYTDNAVQTVSFAEGGMVENPAVRLSLHSDRMEQTLERWLAIAPLPYRKISLGPAELEILQAESSAELESLLNTPVKENENPFGTVKIVANGGEISLDVKSYLQREVGIDENLRVRLADFFPDFKLDGRKQPISVSDRLNNPALQLEVSSDRGVEQWFVFGRDFPPVRSLVSGESLSGISIDYALPAQQSADYFRVILDEEGKVYYAAKSSRGFKSGELAIGQAIAPGWADFQITIEQLIPNAKLQREILPLDVPNNAGTPALLVETQSGLETWLPWGQPTAIDDLNGEIFAAFSPKFVQLPFAVKLEDFIVDRNEGSQSVAMWTSKIRIDDAIQEISEHRKVWMNHPTWYRGWKIAQASWNPGDLKQSTLQVKREPAWVTGLTWSGSGLVVSGIFIMFYGRGLIKNLYPEKDSDPTSDNVEVPASSLEDIVTSS